MYARDFCYWLQGAIELGGLDEKAFSENVKVDMIENHLNMVSLMDEKDESRDARNFCLFLKGAIGMRDSFPVSYEDVKARLHGVFEHEIDPSFPAEKAKQLDTAHNPVSAQNNHHDIGSSHIIIKC